jgi:hypothetical protein
MIAIELNILILYAFNIDSIPYRSLDLYQTLIDVIPNFNSNFKHYIVLKPSDFPDNQQNYLVILLIILYFVSLQLNLYINQQINKDSQEIQIELTTTELLHIKQSKIGRIHVLLDKPKGRDFTKGKGFEFI